MHKIKLLREIARGGQARVCLAELENGSLVAAKIFDEYAIFEREISFLAELDHVFITKFIASSYIQGQPVILTEYIHGPNFAMLLDTYFSAEKTISPMLALLLAHKILDFLSYLASRNIIYADLAGENILLCSEKLVFKICDFGAAYSQMAGPSFNNKLFGRRDFLAPEVLAHGDYSPWSDLYAFGALLFEALMQRRFCLEQHEADLAALRCKLGEAYNHFYYLLSSCLSASAWKRPKSAHSAYMRLALLSTHSINFAQAELRSMLNLA